MYRLMYQDYKNGPKHEFSAHRSREGAERAKEVALKDPFWRDYIFSVEAELDQSLVDQFVEEAKAELAKASELILLPCGTARAWAASYMLRLADMDQAEFSAYVDAVSIELVACGVLKPDNRRHRGMAHNPDRMRVSQKWWRKHAHSN